MTPATARHDQRWKLLAMLVDIVMLVLILANLGLILFDWLYDIASVQRLLGEYLPLFSSFYSERVHANFSEIDLAFVSIYLLGFGAQWLVAIWRKTYHRWFFYPFIHWYDLLGCIPVGSFRWLRILRVVSILLRLQQLGWIDLKSTYPGRAVIKYYQVLVEEISDRVVINVLDGAQREISQGSPVLEHIQQEVLSPRKAALLDMVSHQLAVSVIAAHQQHRTDLETYLGRLTDEVLEQSMAGRQLRALPFAGRLLRQQVQQLGLALVDALVDDLSAPENQTHINQVLDSLLQTEGDKPLTPLVQDILYGAIEQIKRQIAVQQWKLEEELKDA
jgi:hypothetical protein